MPTWIINQSMSSGKISLLTPGARHRINCNVAGTGSAAGRFGPVHPNVFLFFFPSQPPPSTRHFDITIIKAWLPRHRRPTHPPPREKADISAVCSTL